MYLEPERQVPFILISPFKLLIDLIKLLYAINDGDQKVFACFGAIVFLHVMLPGKLNLQTRRLS